MKRFNWIMSWLVVGWSIAMVLLVFLFGAMKAEDFVTLVTNLRKSQRAYFKERKHSDLIESKRLETLVDRALADGISIPIEAVLDTREDGPDLGEQIGLFE